MTRKHTLFAVAMLGVVTLLVTACGGAAGSEQPAPPPIESSVQFSWIHDVEFIAFYEADRQGYYADANLEVRLDAGGFDSNGAYIDPVQRVLNGEVDFGVAGADQILRARAQGQPVVAIASIYQRSPVVLMSLGEKNIVSPQDLVGQRIGTQPPSITVGIVYEALLRSQGIDHSELSETSEIDFSTVDPLFNDEVDVMQGFITNQAIQAQLRSDEVNLILMSDYGIDIYSNVIFTTEDMIANHPDRVEAFVRATTRGTQWAVDNPDEAADYALENYIEEVPNVDVRAVQTRGMLASIPLLNPAGSRPGMMQAEAWQTAHEILLDQGLLDAPLNLEEAYTLEFLDRVYAEG